jgi:hypothetical protein
MASIEIFFCYAREDEDLRKGLEKQLRALKRQGLIDLWHDREIAPGLEWESEIDKHLNTAQVILLLISPDFMDSDYCYGVEMKRAMQRHKRGDARVIPIILRPVYWYGAPFGKLQALPADAKPVKSWGDLDEAFFNIAEGIRDVIEKIIDTRKAEEERNRKATEAMRTRKAKEQALLTHKSPYLVVVSTGELLPLTKVLMIVGRTDAELGLFPDIDLVDKSVARRHAYLKNQQDRITIEDLNALNKTRLNGVVLTPHEEHSLIEGDVCFV